jgi:hypothetical protein
LRKINRKNKSRSYRKELIDNILSKEEYDEMIKNNRKALF